MGWRLANVTATEENHTNKKAPRKPARESTLQRIEQAAAFQRRLKGLVAADHCQRDHPNDLNPAPAKTRPKWLNKYFALNEYRRGDL